MISRAATLAAQAYHVFRPMIYATTRSKLRATRARQVAMYLANCAGNLPIDRLVLGFRRHHSTIAHNIALIEDQRDVHTFDEMIAGLEHEFSNPAQQ